MRLVIDCSCEVVRGISSVRWRRKGISMVLARVIRWRVGRGWWSIILICEVSSFITVSYGTMVLEVLEMGWPRCIVEVVIFSVDWRSCWGKDVGGMRRASISVLFRLSFIPRRRKVEIA